MTGKNRLSDKTLTKIVHSAALSVPGVCEISSSWADFGNKSYPRADVVSNQQAGLVTVDIAIATAWPAPTSDIGKEVQRTIASWVEAYTGLKCMSVHVNAEQTVNGRGRITPAQLEAHVREPVLVHPTVPKPIELRPIEVKTTQLRGIDAGE